MLSTLNANKLIEEALAIEAEEAKRAGALGYMARAMVQATLPHSSQPGNEFTRTNGTFSLTIMTPSRAGGLPYGSIPRLLLAWMTTEAVRTKSPVLELGPSLSGFMAELGLTATGGRWGSIPRLRLQMTRLLSSYITCVYQEGHAETIQNIGVANRAQLWWNPKEPEQSSLWQSTLELTQPFYDEVTSRPVPIDLRALKALKRSPMALDIYNWLTYRMSYLSKTTCIPWAGLEMQFGADYAEPRLFKHKFLEQLRKVSVVYPEAKLDASAEGLIIHPSKPHVNKLVG
jgi:hypothetical protein